MALVRKLLPTYRHLLHSRSLWRRSVSSSAVLWHERLNEVLPPLECFTNRHIGPSEQETEEMLRACGVQVRNSSTYVALSMKFENSHITYQWDCMKLQYIAGLRVKCLWCSLFIVEYTSKSINPFITHSPTSMYNFPYIQSMDELITKTVPEIIRLNRPLKLDPPLCKCCFWNSSSSDNLLL